MGNCSSHRFGVLFPFRAIDGRRGSKKLVKRAELRMRWLQIACPISINHFQLISCVRYFPISRDDKNNAHDNVWARVVPFEARRWALPILANPLFKIRIAIYSTVLRFAYAYRNGCVMRRHAFAEHKMSLKPICHSINCEYIVYPNTMRKIMRKRHDVSSFSTLPTEYVRNVFSVDIWHRLETGRVALYLQHVLSSHSPIQHRQCR